MAGEKPHAPAHDLCGANRSAKTLRCRLSVLCVQGSLLYACHIDWTNMLVCQSSGRVVRARREQTGETDELSRMSRKPLGIAHDFVNLGRIR
jgi:hypothetical protein